MRSVGVVVEKLGMTQSTISRSRILFTIYSSTIRLAIVPKLAVNKVPSVIINSSFFPSNLTNRLRSASLFPVTQNPNYVMIAVQKSSGRSVRFKCVLQASRTDVIRPWWHVVTCWVGSQDRWTIFAGWVIRMFVFSSVLAGARAKAVSHDVNFLMDLSSSSLYLYQVSLAYASALLVAAKVIDILMIIL